MPKVEYLVMPLTCITIRGEKVEGQPGYRDDGDLIGGFLAHMLANTLIPLKQEVHEPGCVSYFLDNYAASKAQTWLAKQGATLAKI